MKNIQMLSLSLNQGFNNAGYSLTEFREILSAPRIGIAKASQTVFENAVDWLASHQEADGRWDWVLFLVAGYGAECR